MISYRTKRSHARSRINRIFSRVVFLEMKLGVSVLSSLFMWGGILPVESDFEWQSQRKNHLKKWVFLCRQSFTLPKKLSGQKIFCSLSWFPVLIGNYFVFPSIFFLLLSSDLRSGILLFLFFSFFFWSLVIACLFVSLLVSCHIGNWKGVLVPYLEEFV